MKLRVVTGGRGSGKSTYLLRRVNSVAMESKRVGGVISVAVFNDKKRVGYDLLDPADGGRRCLAREIEGEKPGLMVGSYLFEEDALEHGRRAIIESVRGGVDLVVIDEVGPLECRGDGWAKALRVALEECGTDQELCVVVRPSLVSELPKVFSCSAWCEAEYIKPPWPDLQNGEDY